MAEACTDTPRWEVVIEAGTEDVIVERTVVEVVIETGPRGPAGATELVPGYAYAAETLPSGGLVALNTEGKLIRADAASLIPAIGLTREAAEVDAHVKIVQIGRVNGFTGLTPGGPCWLGASGALTQTAPVSGLTQGIGVALAADTILLDLQIPILPHG
jgi:hypothetical protein